MPARDRIAGWLAVPMLASGCAMLLGDPATNLGAGQDRYKRKIDTQYDPALPGKLRTDYEERGREIDDDASAREWQELVGLFRARTAQVPFRDEPSRCPDPGTVLSCSATQGCERRQRSPSRPSTRRRVADVDVSRHDVAGVQQGRSSTISAPPPPSCSRA